MSLLDRKAPHVVEVQNRAMIRNEDGARVMQNDGPRHTVRCMHEPVRDWSSAEESTVNGLQMVNLVVIRSREWPGDVHSHVFIDGEKYETVGAPQRHSVSRRTRHWRITVRWIGKDD